jgi:hypothetical protein
VQVEKPNTDPIELRVRYDCTFQQANTMLELLDGYFQLYNPHMTPAEEAIFEQRQNDPRKQRASPYALNYLSGPQWRLIYLLL